MLLSALAACGGGGGGAPATSGAQAPSPPAGGLTSLEIAELVYTDRQRTPSGFYAEAPRYDAAYATLTHLKTTDLSGAGAGTVPHEVCSNDFAQALAWSEDALLRAGTAADLVETNGGDRTHEFVWVTRTTPAAHVLHRVLKCTWLDRSGTDLRAASGPAGRYGKPAFNATDLRQLGEYLWTFGTGNNAGHAVLASTAASATAGTLAHTLEEAVLVRGATGSCDRVETWRNVLSAAIGDGQLTRTMTLVASFNVERVNGVARLCPAT
jgi:hypothetical protein